MRVLIDTNVLISAALRADGTPWLAYQKEALIRDVKDKPKHSILPRKAYASSPSFRSHKNVAIPMS